MSRKIAVSTRVAKNTEFMEELLNLCGECVAAVLRLMRSISAPADGISYHKSIGCPPFGAAIQRTQMQPLHGTRYPSGSCRFSGFSKSIRYLTQHTTE